MSGRGLNKVQIIGNLGKDPDMRYTPAGKAVTNFSVAVSRSVADGQGRRTEETEWFRVVAWEGLAETCNQYLHKGSKVYIEGRLQTRTWKDDNGQDQKMVEVVAGEMLMLDSRTSEPSTGGTAVRAGSRTAVVDRGAGDPEDNDIPF